MERGSGVLLHITSLPSPYGIGGLGGGAYAFADFLSKTKQKYWQILPLNPTDPISSNSPYSSISSFAGNPLLIDPDGLVSEGLILKKDAMTISGPPDRVDYSAVIPFKRELLLKAFGTFRKRTKNAAYKKFCKEHLAWLDDYALFVSLKTRFDEVAWNEWPAEYRDRHDDALAGAAKELAEPVEREKFIQYIFFSQWSALKKYANAKKVRIIGDIPIYVSYDSADVWAHPEFFKLDDEKRPTVVAGVPPDYFSATGQRWGNPIYRWDALKRTGYRWWFRRMEHMLGSFDIVRVDHFRGFVDFWEIPAHEKTAINGQWDTAPADEFFTMLLKRFPKIPIIAEDLGIITDEVRRVIRKFKFPNMKILIFAFGEDNPDHPYLPQNLPKNCVVYTGTHDNNTVRGWLDREAAGHEKERFLRAVKRAVPDKDLPWEMIRMAMGSPADIAITPMQDILGLGEGSRMNVPATTSGNWEWRLEPGQITPSVRGKLSRMTKSCGRD